MLAKLNSAWRPADHDADKEIITEEERECFRKIGQKMESSLLLGKEKVHFLSSSIYFYFSHSGQSFCSRYSTFEVIVIGLADPK